MDRLKRIVKKTPVVRDIARAVMRQLATRKADAFDSADYWESRYKAGRNSGAGSYDRLAEFKADVLNQFVAEKGITSVIEFGCGDGSQLKLATYPSYVGVDVSRTVLAATSKLFSADPTKTFIHIDDLGPQHQGEASLSLDVIYHLVENSVFNRHMEHLFNHTTRYVVIYSSNEEKLSDSIHVRHRKFSDWIEENRPDFRAVGVVRNAYPFDTRDLDNTSFADFYFFERRG